MISIEELNQIKEKRNTTLYYEEKEYLQYIFLNAISKYSEDFIFKGGTCLRIIFDLERASEDLDFSTSLGINEIRKIVNKCLRDFDLLNIKYKVYAEKEFKGNIRFEIRFEGPLFVGKNASTNALKIDFNHLKVKNKTARVVQKLFSDVPLFTTVAMEEKEILAEKIRALINRSESRDLYDIWMLLSKKVEVNKELIINKLKEENSSLDQLKIPSEKEYERDLKYLINNIPFYEQVKKEVLELINKL
ncbi:nucleotidyl transferase AbiEii/AbiGii toxin family protein [Candidatus Woesearchaeota archaeon]|nr:nucleotidyl transferase AbiEii/AbiGii toxin family protein [Candidatus Woesearchaeota archaeon]